MKKKPNKKILEGWFSKLTNFQSNRFHPLVWIVGKPKIGKDVYIGGFSEVNAKGAKVSIGDFCDIASFVSINAADSHLKCIELKSKIVRKNIKIEDHVFIGSHSVIKAGANIGHHSVIAAGSIVGDITVPPFSLVVGNPASIKIGYYKKKRDDTT